MPGLHIDRVGDGDQTDISYQAPVLNLNELANISTDIITDRERRFVESEGCDYFFNTEAVIGDVAPINQIGEIGFWIRDKDNIEDAEQRILNLENAINQKQSTLVTDGSLYIDQDNIIRANVSDFDEVFLWVAGSSQKFNLAFTPTYITGVLVNGQEIMREVQWSLPLPNVLEIIDTLDDGDYIKIKYQHYIIQP